MHKDIFKQVRKGVVFVLPGKPQSYDLTKKEWQAMCNLVEDWSIIIKPVDEDSCVVIWDQEDYTVMSTYTDVEKFYLKTSI